MSSQTDAAETSDLPPRRESPLRVVNEACRTDDVSKIKHAIELASLPTSRNTVQDVLSHAVSHSVIRNAPKVLSCVFSMGAAVPQSSMLPGENGHTLEILDVLITHGWDINARSRGEVPFLWLVPDDHELVLWALDHGATVQPRGQKPCTDNEYLRDDMDCPPLLEQAVRYGCEIATFDLLRSKGAPMTRRVLHLAAQTAACCVKGWSEPHVALVRHLLDKYNLDVNALDGPENVTMGNHYGTPLYYVAFHGGNFDSKDVIELLLERGADPDLVVKRSGTSPMDHAKRTNNTTFLDTVARWKKKNGNP